MWQVILDPFAQKELDKLDHKIQERIVAALFRLANHPFKTNNVKALVGGGYRLRVGNYRVLYTLKHDLVVILVIKIGHRREVYR